MTQVVLTKLKILFLTFFLFYTNLGGSKNKHRVNTGPRSSEIAVPYTIYNNLTGDIIQKTEWQECLCSCMCIGSFMFRIRSYFFQLVIELQSKGENDSLKPVMVLVFFPAKEYICIFHKKHNLDHILCDGVNMTSQITACQPLQIVNHPSPKMILTAKYRSQFSCRDFITSE